MRTTAGVFKGTINCINWLITSVWPVLQIEGLMLKIVYVHFYPPRKISVILSVTRKRCFVVFIGLMIKSALIGCCLSCAVIGGFTLKLSCRSYQSLF